MKKHQVRSGIVFFFYEKWAFQIVGEEVLKRKRDSWSQPKKKVDVWQWKL